MRSSQRVLLIVLLGLAACHGGSGSSTDVAPPPSAAPSEAVPAAPPPDASALFGTPLPAASVATFQNPNGLPAYDGPVGSIEGTITVRGDAPPDSLQDFGRCPGAQGTYGKLFREGAPLPDGSRPLADALVAVTGYSGFYVRELAESRKVHIDNCAFDTRTVDMTIGQRLEIDNRSTALYAPALAQAPMPALMVAPPNNADPVKLYPLKPAYYTLIDRLGAEWMTADVYVLSYPLHTVSRLDGHYRIDGVPVGKVDVNTRLAAIQQNATKKVEVHANVVSTVDLQLNYKRGMEAPRVISDGGQVPPHAVIH